jgi:glycosyltransferase involved in cell wall biosynthesis
MEKQPRFSPVPVSIIIPANDEEHVIGRCLNALTTDAEPGELEILVVCNGCSDRTADVARRASVDAAILELPFASKSAALNAGDLAATRFPRLYVDADVELPLMAVRAVAHTLIAGPFLCVAPAPRFELAGRPWIVRQFYDIWQRMPYLNDEVVGTGVYALSELGRARFTRFPDLTADDQFVLQQFSQDERLTVRDHYFSVYPPIGLAGLVRIRTRVYRGNAELARSGLARYSTRVGPGRSLARLVRRPSNLAGVAAYVGVNLAAKSRARLFRGQRWERDHTARATAH